MKAVKDKQLDLFEAEPEYYEPQYWDGAEVGAICMIDTPVVEMENGEHGYFYMERCRLIKQLPDKKWLAEIEMGIVHGKPWNKDGMKVVLRPMDMGEYRRWRFDDVENTEI